MLALGACGSSPAHRPTTVVEGEPTPPPAEGNPAIPPPVDPAAATALDYFIGAWSCDGWLFEDDDTRKGVRIDVARAPTAAGAYAISYAWTVSTAAGPYCTLPWAARPEEIQFSLSRDCRFGFSGRGAGQWNGDELGIHLDEDPATPKIPEQPGIPPGAADPSMPLSVPTTPLPAAFRIVRAGAAAFAMHVMQQRTITCNRR
jgi:hypothetical protein